MMLGFESASVINKRLIKIGRGGSQSTDEVRLMFAEKKNAAIEAGMALMFGGTPMGVITRFREHVAANERRLSK
jgi:hypothetical protein